MTMSPARIAKKAGLPVAAIAALTLLLLYLQGTIGGHKVGPHTVPLPETAHRPAPPSRPNSARLKTSSIGRVLWRHGPSPTLPPR